MKTKNRTWFSNHSHTWLVVIITAAIAIVYINLLPNEKIFPNVLIGIIVSHLVIALISFFGLWMLISDKIQIHFKKNKKQEKFDFGWSLQWRKGFAIASLLVFILAVYSYFGLYNFPFTRIIVFTILLLFSFNFFIANVIANSEKQLILPYVDFMEIDGVVLDAGCGSGRSTIALAKVLPGIKIIALDRFDASYLDNGGLDLFNKNIEIAQITQRVEIQKGDITAIAYDENTFDGVISSFMFDHLGNNKQKALAETYRVMKPGSRFLMIILVRGYTSFAIGNVLSLLISPATKWRELFKETKFNLIDEGTINRGTYFLLEKPF